jgi:hypothetical protein
MTQLSLREPTNKFIWRDAGIFTRLAGQAPVASALVIAVVIAAGAQLRTLKEKLPPGKRDMGKRGGRRA